MKSFAYVALAGLVAAPAMAQEKDWNFGDGTTPERGPRSTLTMPFATQA